MKILIIGAGPIGGIVGGRLARQGKDVTLVDIDQDHVRAIRERGLRVEVPDGNFTVSLPTLFPPEIQGRFDIGLIAVRSNHTRDALASIAPHLTDTGILVSLQNGINPPLLEKLVGPERSVGAAIRMNCYKVGPGHVATPARGKLYLGHLNGKTTANLRTVHVLLNSVIPAEMTDNILGVYWGKLTYTCLGYFWGLTEESFRVTSRSESIRRQCVEFFGEMVAVGKAAGVRFTPIKEYDPLSFDPTRPFAERLAALEQMLRDPESQERTGPVRLIKRGTKTEVDYTVAHVVEEGRRLGIPTPQCEKLVQLMHGLEQGQRSFGIANYEELPAPR